MELLFPIANLKSILPLLAVIAGIFVISTKNAIISVFNLIVLYVLVAFYLIYIGMIYLGISYIIIYIGAIAILFLFVIMIIDIEVVEKRSNNYLPLLFLLMSGFFLTLKNILYNIGLIKMKSVKFIEELVFIDNRYGKLFNLNNFNNFDGENKDDLKKDILFNIDKDKNHSLLIIKNKINNKEEKFFDLSRNDYSLKDINYNGYYDLYLDNLKDFSNRIFIELKRDLNLNKCEQ
jgi:NADH-ubiquinone oxidoreductase chain 6